MPIVLLDSHPLSLITYPGNTEGFHCLRQVQALVNDGILVVVPEIIDYELRRKLISDNREKSIDMLDKLGEKGLIYAPLTTESMRKAAELWGWAKKTGQSTASKEKLDRDVILVAQSIILSENTGQYTIIATSDIHDLRRYNVNADKWQNITPQSFNHVAHSTLVSKNISI